MKIIMSIVAFLFFLQIVNAQQNEKKPLTEGERRQRDYIQTGRDGRAEAKKFDCSKVKSFSQAIMTEYDTTTDFDRKRMAISVIAAMPCSEIISFYERVILTDTSEIIRCDAIKYLGWVGATSSIPFLLKRGKDPNVSNYEKACIGTFCAVLEDWKNAEQFLNTYCFTTEEKFCHKCVWAYYSLGNESSKKYYRYIISNSSDSAFINCSAQRLAELGDIETAFPILKKFAESSENEDRRYGAIRGLEAIENKESINVIKKLSNDPDLKIQKQAKEILKAKNIQVKED